jgi:hypothetical protein
MTRQSHPRKKMDGFLLARRHGWSVQPSACGEYGARGRVTESRAPRSARAAAARRGARAPLAPHQAKQIAPEDAYSHAQRAVALPRRSAPSLPRPATPSLSGSRPRGRRHARRPRRADARSSSPKFPRHCPLSAAPRLLSRKKRPSWPMPLTAWRAALKACAPASARWPSEERTEVLKRLLILTGGDPTRSEFAAAAVAVGGSREDARAGERGAGGGEVARARGQRAAGSASASALARRSGKI